MRNPRLFAKALVVTALAGLALSQPRPATAEEMDCEICKPNCDGAEELCTTVCLNPFQSCTSGTCGPYPITIVCGG